MSATIEATAVRERPILFSGPMVRAILDGRKTQTRRVMNPQPPDDAARLGVGMYCPTVVVRGEEEPGDEVFGAWTADGEWAVRCPFGAPGDRLWVREAWKVFGGDEYAYQQHQPSVMYRADAPWGEFSYERGWKPSIHMPRWASRLTLEVTGVRVERLQDITPHDAQAEGISYQSTTLLEGSWTPAGLVASYRRLWDSLNAARGFGWDANPYVWVVEFRRVEGAQ